MSGKASHITLQGNTRAAILYEDESVIAMNKPPGILCVPIAGLKAKNLQQSVERYLQSKRQRTYTVHRIDRYTSGVVLFAKHARARSELVRQFRSHEPSRVYLALVRGTPVREQDTLEHSMKRIKDGFRNVVVPHHDPQGTPARLSYRLVERLGEVSLLEVTLDTGLKNQIRVQLAEIGHPVVGDRHYSSKEVKEALLNRQALHASELGFVHPILGKKVHIEAPLPKDLYRLLVYYRRSIGQGKQKE